MTPRPRGARLSAAAASAVDMTLMDLPFDVTATASSIEKEENDLVVNVENRIGAPGNMRRLLRDGDRWSLSEESGLDLYLATSETR